MARRPSIRDVAELSGVSTATVSHVLSGRKTVRPATAEAVHAAIEELGYRRNRSAAALRKGTSDNIVVIVPDITNPFHAEIIAGIEEVAAEHDALLRLMSANMDVDRERRYLLDVMASDARAVVFVPSTAASLDMIQEFESGPGPRIIMADGVVRGGRFSTISVDNEHGGNLVAEHFAKIGRTAAVAAGAPLGLITSRDRIDTFRDRARELGIEVRDEWLTYGERRTADAVDKVVDLIESNPQVDAFFAGGDLLAVFVMAKLRERHIRIPEDVAVCGFDNIPWTELVHPTLTTIGQPIREIGREAARVALAPPTDVRQDIILPVELIVRGSTIGRPTL